MKVVRRSKGRYVDRVNETELDKNALELVLEDFLDTQKEMKEELAEMKKKQEQMDTCLKISYSKLDVETKKCEKAERQAKKLKSQLDFAKKNKFGDKRKKVNKATEGENGEGNPDRDNEKDNFDGTDDMLETKSVSEPCGATEAKKEQNRDLSKRPDTYNGMGVQGYSVEHPSNMAKVPGRVLDRKMVKVFHFETRLVEEHFEMIHYVEKGKKPKWGYFPKSGIQKWLQSLMEQR